MERLRCLLWDICSDAPGDDWMPSRTKEFKRNDLVVFLIGKMTVVNPLVALSEVIKATSKAPIGVRTQFAMAFMDKHDARLAQQHERIIEEALRPHIAVSS